MTAAYAAQLAKTVADTFRELGGEVVAEEAVAPTDVDMRPVLTGIAAKEPCLLYYPIFVAAAAQVTRQAPEIPGLENTKVMGSSALLAPGFLEGGGRGCNQSASSSPTWTPPLRQWARSTRRSSRLTRRNSARRRSRRFTPTLTTAREILIAAIENVAVTDDNGTTYIGRKEDALFATKGHEGISG